MSKATDDLADALFAAPEPKGISSEARLFMPDELRALARAAAAVGWDEALIEFGHKPAFYINPYTTVEETI